MSRSFLSASIYTSILLVVLCGKTVYSIRADDENSPPKPTKQILFVCTGNFYRSRFAEIFFNQKSHEGNARWKAISRGLALEPSQHGISSIAMLELEHRRVPLELCTGTPRALTQQDLDQSDYIVLMDEAQHRAMFEKKFPKFDQSKIHYWHVPDGRSNATHACQLMAKNIDELVPSLPQ